MKCRESEECVLMKSNAIAVLCILLVLVLLIPIPIRLKDGGTVEYRAVLYCVTDVHRISPEIDGGYIDGTVVEILGMEIYNDVE